MPKLEATGGVQHELLWTVERKSENWSPMPGTPDNKLRVSFSKHGECSAEVCLKPVDKIIIIM